MNLIIVVQVRK